MLNNDTPPTDNVQALTELSTQYDTVTAFIDGSDTPANKRSIAIAQRKAILNRMLSLKMMKWQKQAV